MKKTFAFIVPFLFALATEAQTFVWKDGAVILRMENGTPDSITFRDPLTQNYISTSETNQIIFSPGNLQYLDNEPMWRFAPKQYDVLGTLNVNRSIDEFGYVANWIDLFGWSTSSWSDLDGTPHEPASTSTDYKDYILGGNWANSISDKDYWWADWGVNFIEGYGNGWRTLTSDEWDYIFTQRPNAPNLFALGTIAGQRGLIILPDQWQTPTGITFTPSTQSRLVFTNGLYIDNDMVEDNFLDNVYTEAEWNRMEGSGAVFLPAAGRRWGLELRNFGWADWGVYWSSTTGSQEREGNVRALGFYISGVTPRQETSRAWGASVRLVMDRKKIK